MLWRLKKHWQGHRARTIVHCRVECGANGPNLQGAFRSEKPLRMELKPWQLNLQAEGLRLPKSPLTSQLQSRCKAGHVLVYGKAVLCHTEWNKWCSVAFWSMASDHLGTMLSGRRCKLRFLCRRQIFGPSVLLIERVERSELYTKTARKRDEKSEYEKKQQDGATRKVKDHTKSYEHIWKRKVRSPLKRCSIPVYLPASHSSWLVRVPSSEGHAVSSAK